MILILSEPFDTSTTDVIEWLDFYNKKYVRVNANDPIEIEFHGNDVVFKIDTISFKLSEIKSFWFRRGRFSFSNDYDTSISQFENFQQNELDKIIQLVYYKLNIIKHLNSIKNADVNKLIVNEVARKLDIKTPNDFIFSEFESIKEHFDNSKQTFITKPISSPMQSFDDFTIFNYAKLIDLEKVKAEKFLPSLVQNYIEKKYELRIFYLDGEFYTMAIFSQKDNQTAVDFRDYNYNKPNRTVPFKLPITIENKLDALMKELDLNSGSIDMIITPDNEYVFLEVNPVGQFGMTSYPCHYNLEKKIAQYL